jgi:predicted Fe-Mo cluster-binding NifX family protein
MEEIDVKRVPVIESVEAEDNDASPDDLDSVLTETSNPELDAEQAAKDAAAVAEALANDNEEATVFRKNGWTPMQAIKNKCMDCCNFQRKELYLCQVKGCPLWPFRKGRKPVKRQVSEEFRAAASERFKKMHAAKKEA